MFHWKGLKMELKIFALLAGAVGTVYWVAAYNVWVGGGAFLSDDFIHGLYLWLAAAVLYAFSDVVGYLKVLAENSEKPEVIAADKGPWEKKD
jgi:hypothetical protein